MGGSIGTSLPSTIYASTVVKDLTSHPRVPGLAVAAQDHGDTTAFWWAAGIFGLGFLLTLLIMPSQCEARSATTVVALARYAIGACNHEDAVHGAAVANGAGSRRGVWRPRKLARDRVRHSLRLSDG